MRPLRCTPSGSCVQRTWQVRDNRSSCQTFVQETAFECFFLVRRLRASIETYPSRLSSTEYWYGKGWKNEERLFVSPLKSTLRCCFLMPFELQPLPPAYGEVEALLEAPERQLPLTRQVPLLPRGPSTAAVVSGHLAKKVQQGSTDKIICRPRFPALATVSPHQMTKSNLVIPAYSVNVNTPVFYP